MTSTAPAATTRRLFHPSQQPPFAEFVALIAMMFATTALSIDAMLPALPDIAADLQLSSVNHAQFVVTGFMAGLGIGQLFTGPLSDSLGRRQVIMWGILLFVVGGALAFAAPSLTVLLLARFLQGLGISAPRIVGIAMVRDLYQGRMMARVMSIVMTIFILVPAAAPFFGQLIIVAAGWRAIFGALSIFGIVAILWLALRQPETHPPERRRPFRLATILSAMREILGNRAIVIYILCISLGFGAMFSFISSAQQVYADTFGKAASFPAWFAGHALIAGTAGPINATLVMRLGMRRLATFGFVMQAVLTILVLTLWQSGVLGQQAEFPVFFVWASSIFFMNGLIFGNLNALALEKVGHIAGLAASIVGAVSTLLAVLIATPVGQAFDGTPVPLMLGCASFAVIGSALMIYIRRRTGG